MFMYHQPVKSPITLLKVRIVPQEDKQIHQLLETQAQKISTLEEQVCSVVT